MNLRFQSSTTAWYIAAFSGAGRASGGTSEAGWITAEWHSGVQPKVAIVTVVAAEAMPTASAYVFQVW
jgi:hypothetical protein